MGVVKPFSQIPVPRRFALAALFCAFALALPFAANAAEVEGTLFLANGIYDPASRQYSAIGTDADGGLAFYTSTGTHTQDGLGFATGSIVQIVAVTQAQYESLANTTPILIPSGDWEAATGQDFDYSTQNKDSYFAGASTGQTLDPTSTLDGQKVVMTTALDGNLEVNFRFDYSDLVDQGYVGFYLRVFSATDFPQGEPVSNVVWGASSLYKFQGDVPGGEQVIFSGMTIAGTNTFEVIPEPATASLFLFGAAALLARRRRTRSRGGRTMNAKILLPALAVCTLFSGTLSARAEALGLVTPVYLMPDEPVTDALGEPFPGTCNAGDGGLVEIRAFGTGIVPPDPVTGQGDDTANPLLASGHLGDNTLGRDTGLFTLALTRTNEMPALGKTYFARVYDAPEPVEATLYADSEPFSLANYSSVRTTTRLYFNESLSIDPASDPYVDSNGDGYTDREEAFYRGHDSDADGWSDWFEINHGMDPNTPFAFDAIALEDIEEPDLAYAGVSSIDELTDEELASIPWTVTGKGISWTAVSGVTYVIEFADTLLDRDAFTAILTNLAESTDGFADVSEYFTNTLSPIGFFRVKAVPQPGEGPAAE